MLHPILADNPGRPSKIRIPERAHPLARLVFQLMRKHNVSYELLEEASGVLRQTLKSYRLEKIGSLRSYEALLGAFGYRLLPCPSIDDLPAHLRDQLEEIGQHFVSDDQTLAAAIFAATSRPRVPTDGPAPRIDYRAPLAPAVAVA